MAKLNLVVAQAIKPVLGASQESSRQLEHLAERAGLPPHIVEQPAGFIPLHATESFLNLLQRRTGDPAFLFACLDLDPEESRQTHSVAGVPLPSGLTGTEALIRLTESFNNFITGARFLCEAHEGLFWIMRTTGATEWSEAWPVLQYNLSIMFFGTRRILGRHVWPRAMMLPVQPPTHELPQDLRDLPTMLNVDRFGLAFRISDIASLQFVLAESTGLELQSQTSPICGVTRRSVGDCISRFVMSQKTDRLSERVARAFGMSPRSYRRHMSELGTTHGSLVADVRLEIAFELLADSTCTVTEVAFELGYEHPGDFTRFFKGRTGLSPVEYRHRETTVMQ